MAADTTYDLGLQYTWKGREAVKGLHDLAGGAEHSSKALEHLNKQFHDLKKMVVEYFAFREAYHWLVGYNAELETTQATLRNAVMLAQGLGFEGGTKVAAGLMKEFHQDAEDSVASMEDMAKVATQIAEPLKLAGFTSAKMLHEVARDTATAAQAFQIPVEEAANTIDHILQGTVSARDHLAQFMGLQAATVNAMTAPQRLDALRRALSSEEMRKAAEAQTNTYAGALSMFKKTAHELFGTIGKPLFEAMTRAVRDMNGWFKKNRELVADIAKSIASGIGGALKVAAEVIGAIVKNRTLFMALAAAAGAAALGNKMMAAGAGGAAGAVGGAAGGLAMNAFGTKIPVGGAIMALGALAVAAQSAADAIDQQQEAEMDRSVKMQGLMRDVDRAAESKFTRDRTSRQSALLGHAQEMGLVHGNKIDRMALMMTMGGPWGNKSKLARATAELEDAIAHESDIAALKFGLRVRDFFNRPDWQATAYEWGRNAANSFADMMQPAWKEFMSMFGITDKLKPQKPQVNIGKIEMKIESNDPDAIAIGMEGYFEEWTRNPTTPPRAIRG